MLKLAVLASGNGTNAEAILESVRTGKLDAEIRVILTNRPDAGVVSRAAKWNVPLEVIPSKGCGDRDVYDSRVVEALLRYGIDTVALAGWMRILSQTFLDAFPGRIVNLHPAILPSFKGGTGIADAYAYAVRISGCSVHLVCPELDGGPLIIQAAVPVDGTLQEFEDRVHRMEHLILPQALQWLGEGRLSVDGRKVTLLPPVSGIRKIDYVDGCLISPPLEERL